jgi:hypothetical protein
MWLTPALADGLVAWLRLPSSFIFRCRCWRLLTHVDPPWLNLLVGLKLWGRAWRVGGRMWRFEAIGSNDRLTGGDL